MLLTKVVNHIFFVQKIDSKAYGLFYPLSLAALLDADEWPKWVIGLLNSFNLFEWVFTLSLGYGLSPALENKRAFTVGVLVNIVITVLFSLFGSMLSIGPR